MDKTQKSTRVRNPYPNTDGHSVRIRPLWSWPCPTPSGNWQSPLVDLLSDMGAVTALHRNPDQIQSEANQEEACTAADVGCYQLQIP